MLKILITDTIPPQALTPLQTAKDVIYDIKQNLTEVELVKEIGKYNALIMPHPLKISATVLSKAKVLQVIGQTGADVDNIDINQASLQGIIVMNTPGVNSITVAEYTMALLLALARHIPQACQSLANKSWQPAQFIGTELYRKTIGIIGLGQVGSRVAVRCQAFGMKVIAYDPYIGNDAARGLKVTLVDLDELFTASDFISLHAAHTPETKNIINAQAITQMKDGVQIINCAKGTLIDETALAEAITSGKVGGVALDVFGDEPLDSNSPLYDLPNVIITPHIASHSYEAQRDLSSQIISQVVDALQGNEIRNAVNMPLAEPKVLQTMRPFMDLAERVGSLQTQLADKRINRVELEFAGELNAHVKLLAVALLKGLLSPIMAESVNYVNAPHLARQRGITVSQARGFDTLNYPNLITCKVIWDGASNLSLTSGSRIIAATIFGGDEPRIVQVDHYRMDVKPEGQILVMDSLDVPGVIGRLGTILSWAGVNIASMRLGRTKQGGSVLTFVKVDEPVSSEVINQLLVFEPIYRIRQVML